MQSLHCLRFGGVTIDSHHKILLQLTSALRGTLSKRSLSIPHSMIFWVSLYPWDDLAIELIQFERSLSSLGKNSASGEDLLKDYGLERVCKLKMSWYKCSSRSLERVSCLLFFINSESIHIICSYSWFSSALKGSHVTVQNNTMVFRGICMKLITKYMAALTSLAIFAKSITRTKIQARGLQLNLRQKNLF